MNAPAPALTVLGFDYGRWRIGVAVGQSITGTARPLATIAARGGRPDWAGIARLVADWSPQRLIVGLPAHADGSEGAIAASARAFAHALGRRHRIPVECVDERLSSWAAERTMAEHGRRAAVDPVAAALIVESWLAAASDRPHA